MQKKQDRHDKYQENARWKYLELENILREYSFDPNDETTQPIAAWMMKAFELVDSMFALSKTNSEIGMIVLCRSVMEYCLWAKFVSLDPGPNLERWKLAEIRNEIATLKKGNNSSHDINILEKKQKELEALDYTAPRMTDIFAEIDEPALIRPYDWLSKYTHGKLSVVFDEVYKKRSGDDTYSLVMFAELEDIDKQILWEGVAVYLKYGIEAIRSREISDLVNVDSSDFLKSKITVGSLNEFIKWKFPDLRVEAKVGKSLHSIVQLTRVAQLNSLSEVDTAIDESTEFIEYCEENDGSDKQVPTAGSVTVARSLTYQYDSVRKSGIVSDKYIRLAKRYSRLNKGANMHNLTNYLCARWNLLEKFWLCIIAGTIVCALFMNPMGWWETGGLILITSALLAEFIHLQSEWREYLSSPHINNDGMWITQAGSATAAGFHLSPEFYKLLRTANTSFSQRKYSRNFVRILGKRYDQMAMVISGLFVVLGTAVTLVE